MPDTLIKVDLTKSAYENDKIHNRWHPDIPIVEWVNPGDDFIIETVDWTGGFIKNNDSADDVRDIDLSIVHFLSGPIGVKGAEPGDLLVVDLLDVGPLKESLWGFNGFFSKKNGGGFLTDHFPLAQKAPARCRRANMAAIATSRICRAVRRSTSRSMCPAAGFRWAICISARA